MPDRRDAGSVGGWLSPALVVGFIIAWSLLIYFLIGERPMDWSYGVVPYVPAQSFLSNQGPPSGPTPRQVDLVPAAARRRINGHGM